MYADRIELNPRVCAGRPVIKGTRIPVAMVIAQLSEGLSWSEVLAGYPELAEQDIRAALEYASAAVEHTEFVEVA